MATPGYTVTTGTAAIALAAATAKTLIDLLAAANDYPTVVEFGVSFDGVTPSAVPVLVELCHSTEGAAGTSTGGTIRQVRGPRATANITAGVNYTVEPTTLTVLKHWLVPPTSGMVMQFPLGREPEGIVTAATAGKGLCLRVTAPAIVNVRAYIEYEE